MNVTGICPSAFQRPQLNEAVGSSDYMPVGKLAGLLMNDEFRMWIEAVVISFKLLSWNYPRESEENQGNPQPEQLRPGKD
jgi:hypothetical protein